ncbi:MAG TPA: prolipoprotein diacylglyceryl transferase family protein [Steroidobacteraceae bacterium]|jgi:phosphatidylglycerol:prolipoprotein diacylglycerol transferase|nr:prolipoprotein diacylglyceryl transferase family protein [Steroidobacteraceae bacterium]
MAYPYLSDVLRGLFGINVPLPVPMFGLMVGIAFFVSLRVANREVKRLIPGQPPSFMDNVGFIGFIAGIIGARVFHLLEHPREFLEHPLEMAFSRGGFTIFGGLIASILAGLLYARKKGAPLATLLDAGAPALMLGYGLGRIGCQISGDGDWGIAADLAAKPSWLPTWFWAQTYDGNIAGVLIPSPGVYPTPLYEVVMGLAAFALLWKLRKHGHRAGWLFAVYLVLAGVERLLIEFIRVNVTYHLFGFEVTQAQLIAVAFIVGGSIGMWKLWRPRAVAA